MYRRRTGDQGARQTIFEAPFWRFFALLGDFFLLGLFWLITSLPVVTIGASTAALFYVHLKARNGEAGILWKMYKKSFLENLKQAVLMWLLYIFILIDACIIGYMLVSSGAFAWQDITWGGKYNPLLIAALLLYLSMTLYTAALLAFFKQTTAQCMLAALCLTFNRIFSTMYFMIVIAALAFLTLYIFPALILVDVPLAIYLISIRMNRIFQKQIARTKGRSPAEQGISNPPPN